MNKYGLWEVLAKTAYAVYIYIYIYIYIYMLLSVLLM